MASVVLNNIVKTYEEGQVLALDNVSLRIEKGELFGLIGPDGAGKTSVFRILTTLLRADKGEAFVEGYDVTKDIRHIRSRVGYMPGRFSLYQDLTVEENIHFFAALFGTGIRENYELIREIYDQLAPFKKRRAGKLSGGMKQKLALCCALIHRPEVLFLDEPTTGVDVVSRKEFWDMLKRLKALGITILVSTPYMDEAALCERIALLQHGRVLSVDTPRQIIADYPFPLLAVRSNDVYKLLIDLRAYQGVNSCYAFGEYLHVTLRQPEGVEATEALRRYIERQEHKDVEIKPMEPTIEDRFIQLMNTGPDKARQTGTP